MLALASGLVVCAAGASANAFAPALQDQTQPQTQPPTQPQVQPQTQEQAEQRPVVMPEGIDKGPREAKAIELFERFLNATGGRESFAAVKNRFIESTVTGDGFFALARQWSITPNKMFVEIDIPGRPTSRQYFDGRIGWSPVGDERYDFYLGRRDRDLRADSQFLTYADHERIYPMMIMDEPGDLNGQVMDRVITRSILGKFERHWFDRETGLLMGFETTRSDQGGNAESTVKMFFSDYKDFGRGLLFPENVIQQQVLAGPDGAPVATEVKIRNLRIRYDDPNPPAIEIPEQMSANAQQVFDANQRWQAQYMAEVLKQQEQLIKQRDQKMGSTGG